jgi:A/G-specific adenine glycosylase
MSDARIVAGVLEEWFKKHGRKFPWRFCNDPYRILVVELLLQRTRAEMVSRVYYTFFEKYPTIESLALAKLDDLNKFFSKLGLMYRGIRIKKVAEEILEKYGGTIPCDMNSLLRLRGVGVYIASAVLNFGCDCSVPVVDKNVLRVLSRYLGASRESTAREFIGELYRYGDHEKLAYSLIDVGSLICRNMLCGECPLDKLCPKLSTAEGGWRMLRKVIDACGRVKLLEQPIGKARRSE